MSSSALTEDTVITPAKDVIKIFNGKNLGHTRGDQPLRPMSQPIREGSIVFPT